MRIVFVFLVLAVLNTFSASAQTAGKIQGSLKDELGKGLAAATVSLLRSGDSALIKMAVSDAMGVYEFSTVKEGAYFVSISNIGFSRAFSKVFEFNGSQVLEVPAITLSSNANNLSAVVVQTRRPLVENKIDKMVVNVDAAPTNAGSSALEVLEKSPGISVDRDGNISLKGKQGIIVLMDGKQTYLSGQDLANLLRNMPASQLDQIE
ncbi:MAG: TonB-dependent receptor, partial [Chitinophagaceae bacterium]